MSTLDVGAVASPEVDEAEPEHRVTPLELFFDLVFVFAITQVTSFFAADLTWDGMFDGLLVLGVVWWAWTGYAWLTNSLDAEAGVSRLVIFVAVAAMLVASLAIPQAFGRDATLFALSIAVVRVMHILLYGLSAETADVRGAVVRFAPAVAVSMGLLLAASGTDGTAQELLWGAALVVDYAGPLAARNRWRVHAGHFAERHGLIIIIALGESIVALGVGAQRLALDSQLILVAVLGVAIAGALWWAYFDVAAIVAERRLREVRGPARAAMARDSYSYLHYVMVAGVVLLALGVKKTLGHVDEPLAEIPAVALCGGPALFFLGHLLFRLRNTGTLSRSRPVAIAVLVALVPLAHRVDALVAMALVAAVCVLLIGYEVVRFHEARARIRSTAH
jgi:low temperature requirement protein LtrA